MTSFHLEKMSFIITYPNTILTTIRRDTELSFISSNSSFTGYVKQLIKSSSFCSSFPPSNSDSPTIYDHIDFGSQTKNLPSSESSFQFTFCSWDNCCSEPAGAISCDKSGASLIVMNCKFNNCNSTSDTTATKEYNGGAICVIGLNTLIVSSSLFNNCKAPQTGNDNGGSGGLYIRSIKKVLSISSNDFISCFTGSSGAGLFFSSSYTPKLDTEMIVDCEVINCISQDNSPDGGGMCLWESSYTLYCIGCMFSGCSTTGNGGGFNFNFAKKSEPYPIKFCFFNGNTGGAGNDISLSGSYSLEGKLVLYCLSTSNTNRIAYWTTTWSLGDFNWLPQRIKKYLPVRVFSI